MGAECLYRENLCLAVRRGKDLKCLLAGCPWYPGDDDSIPSVPAAVVGSTISP